MSQATTPARLVALKEAGRAEVVRALLAPHHRVRQATFAASENTQGHHILLFQAALHLHEAAEIPQELVGDDVTQVLPEPQEEQVLQPKKLPKASKSLEER